jgi:hypothetical protein
VRALLLFVVGAFATSGHAQTLQAQTLQTLTLEVTGYTGLLGEWELTANVAARVSPRANEYAGPLTMRHVGICTQDGPEEKSGEIRLQLSEPPSRLQATLLLDGVECRYSGTLSDSYSGEMTCPDRPPAPLRVWLK